MLCERCQSLLTGGHARIWIGNGPKQRKLVRVHEINVVRAIDQIIEAWVDGDSGPKSIWTYETLDALLADHPGVWMRIHRGWAVRASAVEYLAYHRGENSDLPFLHCVVNGVEWRVSRNNRKAVLNYFHGKELTNEYEPHRRSRGPQPGHGRSAVAP